MFMEAYTWSAERLAEELRDMGVDNTLIMHAEADVRLLGGLYIYTLVEGINA